jgi:uncharacterized membrane protein YtjA (UPF0391 family)
VAGARSAHDRAESLGGAGNSNARFAVGARNNAALEESPMLKWAFVFLVIAIIAGIFGFTDVQAASATIAQWLFGIFLVLFLGAVIIALAIGRSLTS